MNINHDSLHFKFGNEKGRKGRMDKSIIYKDKYPLPNGTLQGFLLEIDAMEVSKILACSEEEALASIDATVKAMWRIKSWNY